MRSLCPPRYVMTGCSDRRVFYLGKSVWCHQYPHSSLQRILSPWRDKISDGLIPSFIEQGCRTSDGRSKTPSAILLHSRLQGTPQTSEHLSLMTKRV